jgi:uncharacterized protein YcaQ
VTESAAAPHRLSQAQARRIAVRAQLLDADRPPNLVQMVDRLTLLQLDPTAAIAPSADLVAWSRLGSAYKPADLKQALERDRTLFEFNAVVRPMRDLGLYLAGASAWPPYALPILHEDRLVGKVDAIADRKASVLRVNAIHEDVPFTRQVTAAVRAELDDLGSWLGVDRVSRGR